MTYSAELIILNLERKIQRLNLFFNQILSFFSAEFNILQLNITFHALKLNL